MLVSELISRFRGAVRNAPMDGYTELNLVQDVLDLVWNIDNRVRIKRPEPNIATTAGTLTYAYTTFASDVRKVIGLWKPSLSLTGLADFGYPNLYAPNQYGNRVFFDQKRRESRFYDLSAVVDDENRLITFLEDPGTTTTEWKVDYYTKAPAVSESSTVPILPGWEIELVLFGMLGLWETYKTKDPGNFQTMFELKRKAYYDAMLKDRELRGVDENDYTVLESHVQPL